MDRPLSAARQPGGHGYYGPSRSLPLNDGGGRGRHNGGGRDDRGRGGGGGGGLRERSRDRGDFDRRNNDNRDNRRDHGFYGRGEPQKPHGDDAEKPNDSINHGRVAERRDSHGRNDHSGNREERGRDRDDFGRVRSDSNVGSRGDRDNDYGRADSGRAGGGGDFRGGDRNLQQHQQQQHGYYGPGPRDQDGPRGGGGKGGGGGNQHHPRGPPPPQHHRQQFNSQAPSHIPVKRDYRINPNAIPDERLATKLDKNFKDPSGDDPAQRLTKKAKWNGKGQNTESFDPASTLLGCDGQGPHGQNRRGHHHNRRNHGRR